MSKVTTMGGTLGVDSSGSHWLRYGSASRHVVSMELVLADGELNIIDTWIDGHSNL